jgi:hypothetical protein
MPEKKLAESGRAGVMCRFARGTLKGEQPGRFNPRSLRASLRQSRRFHSLADGFAVL